VDLAGLRRGLVTATLALALDAAVTACPPGGKARWERTNHRGRTVSLLSGLSLAVAATAGVRLPSAAAAVGGMGAALVGAYDDATGARAPGAKGFRGHLSALRAGRVTSGVVKVLGIGTVGVASALLLPSTRRVPLELLVDGGVVAGSANLLNLLDLRPGRALKAGLAGSLALGQPGAAGAAAALLPADLHERAMLGDAGANALGALLGLALLDRYPDRRARLVALGVVTALTAASEAVSFSAVIEASPPLRWMDRLGRLP
jgi:UDP-N-acetylmuramyl pentapeptide phosphotransferase/UDP-N-acetylglucosamine-1-phosphate transferase